MDYEITEICGRKQLLSRDDFIKRVLFSSTNIIRDSEFEEYNLMNKNVMFFLNLINESMSSISMLGSRNLCSSLLGKMNNLFEYNDNIKKQFEGKVSTIPDHKLKYVKDAIRTNHFLDNKQIKNYNILMKENNEQILIENLKLIYKSIIDNKYFETISDELYEQLLDESISNDKFNRIYELTNEYLALLIDYVGISMYEIKRIIKDAYGSFIRTKNPTNFYNMFSNFAESYKKNNKYQIFIKTDTEFDEKLLTALKHSNNNNFMMLSKSGLLKIITSDIEVNNKKTLTQIAKKIEEKIDNNYYIYATLEAKDIWQAIKLFKEKTIQPFIGSMLYSGKTVNTLEKYIVIETRGDKRLINECLFHDDIFKPLSQDFPDYSDVFKRYIIESENSEINKLIDEAVQLLPYYKNSNSTLTKFTNTWFALETLFRNAGDNISNSLKEYAACLVADRMLSGYIYVTAYQIKRTYKNFKKMSNSKVENYILNFKQLTKKDCCYLEWKVDFMENKVKDYDSTFEFNYNESKELISNAYYLRNKQFHGSKDSQMELAVGFIYDIVNDAISFYIDYLDIYRGEKNLSSLFNYIKNIKLIKSTMINDKDVSIDEKIMIAYDAVRKL